MLRWLGSQVSWKTKSPQFYIREFRRAWLLTSGDAVESGRSAEEENSLLEAWKKYRVLLNRVDTSTAPDIEWPEEPDTM
ncbi:phage tail protein [Escherichia coli]|nr:phage tail protein [Escherichia coli]